MELYTSYFGHMLSIRASVVCISIARSQPRGVSLLQLPELAPTYNMLMRYRTDGDWGAYKRDYAEHVLSRLKPEEVVQTIMKLSGGRSAALLCWERKGANCHRHLVADWLYKAGYHVKEL